MSRLRLSLVGLPVLLSLKCGLVSQPIQPTQSIDQATATPPVHLSPTGTPATPTSPTPSPTLAPFIPTTTIATLDSFSAFLAAVTLDPFYATMLAAMSASSMGSIANISQYFHPVGTPLTTWNSIPIMPQATAGQEFKTYVYSFIATATLDQARLFYQDKLVAFGVTNAPATGYGGTGTLASHSVAFFSNPLTMVLTSYDNDTGHVIVVISRQP